MSFVDVLPVEPVTATTRACERSRTARPSAAIAACSFSGTSAAAAPFASASSTKSTPPRTATNRSPGRIRRESISRPVASVAPGQNLQPAGAQARHVRERNRDHAVARSSKATERVPRLLDVGEGDGAIGEGLALLVPLAGDHDDVAVGCVPDGGADGRAPIGLHLDLGATPGAGEDLLDDGLRILRARVVGGYDEHVRQLPGGPSHERALGAVAVAAAAEDAHEPTLRDLPRRAQDVRERVRGVGIVDEHRERLALVDRLEAAGNACDMRDAAHDRIVGQARGAARPRRRRGRSRR